MRWFLRPLRRVLKRVLISLLSLIPGEVWLPILSGPAKGFRWKVGTANHSFWLGRHEAELVRRIWARIPSEGIAYDLGGHAGYYTLMLVRRFRHVHTFEPFPEDLRAHVARNRLESRVTVHAQAVSDFNGTANMLGVGACRRIHEHGTVPVPVVRLDDVDLPDPAFVKIDIEWQEAAALRGMKNRLRRARPTLFIATHSWQTSAEVVAVLEECDYAIESLPDDAIFAIPRPIAGS